MPVAVFIIGVIDVHDHSPTYSRHALRRHIGSQMPLMEDDIIALISERAIAGIGSAR